MDYPLKHISIRVPWHDTGWDGRVCANPHLNDACLKLKRIAEGRDDAAEQTVSGKSLEELEPSQWPVCVAERVGFMAPFEYVRMAKHPYNWGPETTHGHFNATPLRYPPFSAAVVPFEWMLKEDSQKYVKTHQLDVQPEREPKLDFETVWWQERLNHRAVLDCFAGHLKPERSLCFFYAKQAPFIEETGTSRALIITPPTPVTPPPAPAPGA